MPVRNLMHGSLQINDGIGGHSLTIPIMMGNVSFTEKQVPNVVLNRGVLKEFTLGPQSPCVIDFEVTFERWQGKPLSGVPTPFEAMTGRGEAATWKTVLANALNSPFGVNLVFTLADVEGKTLLGYNEVLTFASFVRDEFDFKEGTDANKVTVKGKALVVTPSVTSTASS